MAAACADRAANVQTAAGSEIRNAESFFGGRFLVVRFLAVVFLVALIAIPHNLLP
jgi:hypothetical protein